MKQEVAVIGGINQIRVARKDCKNCGPETLFKGITCLMCGWSHPLKGVGPTHSKKQRSRFARVMNGRLNRDRRAAAHAQAEASRQKFEGGK